MQVTPQEAQQIAQEARAKEIEAARQAVQEARAAVQAATQDAAREGRPVIVQVPGGGFALGRQGSPEDVLRAQREARQELRNQLERLENQREEISDQLNSPGTTDVNKKGLEQRIANIDIRITDVEKQIAEADLAVAKAAAVPGAVQPDPPPPPQSGPPEEFWVICGILCFVVVLPLTIAYARRIWRRGAAAVAAIPQEIYDRFNRLDQAIDSVAIEVERIGEGQRFLTRVQAEQRGLGAGPAERIELPEREAQKQSRK